MSFPLELTAQINSYNGNFTRKFTLNRGLTVLLGPNGSGKTHLLRGLKNSLNQHINASAPVNSALAIMAIWQFTVELIPANWIGGRPTITEDEHNEAEWWGSQQPPSGFEEHLQKLLPEAKSWNSDLRQWGAQKSDLIEVWYENGAIESISVRFDCRNINPALLRGVFELSEDLNCCLVYKRDLSVIGNSLESLIEKLWNSPNHKFLEAPHEWLPKMAKEIADRESKR